MVDNFDQIRKLISFRSTDDFYFLQILQRKKDHKEMKVNGSNNNSRLIKAYYIHSLEYFDFIKPEVIELCKLFNARAGINLNRRSYEKMSLQLLRKVADQIMNKSFNKSYKAYSSVVGAYQHESDKTWIIDVDADQIHLCDDIEDHITNIQPIGNKLIAKIPSKSGYHLITKPFNLKDAKKNAVTKLDNWFSKIEVHRNNPTNLYIP